MQEKNRNILIGSILMISGAGLSVVLTLVYGSVFGRSLEAYVGTLTADEAFAVELAASGMTLDAVVEAMQGTLTVLLVLAVLFQLVKIAVGVWGLRRAARPATAFVAWGAVFLALGLLGMMFSGVTSVFGLCDLAGGVLGPGLFLWGGVQNKLAFRRMLAAERAAEEQQADESAWPPVRR